MAMTVGKIQRLGNKFFWTIPQFFTDYKKYCSSCASPNFVMADSKWYLYLSTSVGRSNGSKRISLNMFRLSGPKGVFSFTLGIEDKSGKNYLSRKVQYDSILDGLRADFSVELPKIMKDRKKISRTKDLTFTCRLNLDQITEETALYMTDEETITECTNVKMECTDVKTGEEDKYFFKDSCCITKGAERSLRNFRALFLNKENSDVTLKVKDREFRAHKAILAAQSSVFDSMFKDDFVEKRNGIVDITDCDPNSFQGFLLYMYSGRVDKMTTSNVVDLYEAADKYDVAELKMECVQFMNQEMSVQTFCDFYALALRYNESKLLERGIEFFVKNAKMIILTSEWQTFGKNNFSEANQLYIKVLYQKL